MHINMSVLNIANELKADEYAGWTYAGALALAAYLDELDDDLGTSSEFDRVAIRCAYTEFADLSEWLGMYYGEGSDEAKLTDDEARDLINDNATFIEFDGGIIVSEF
jgi:hypothetical protein